MTHAPFPFGASLGCGDGRLLSLAVSPAFGASRAIGYELDEPLVAQARAACDDPRVEVRQEDALQAAAALGDVDVVALYLTDRGNASLLPMLREALPRRARVVSYVWGMPDLPPTATSTAVGPGVVVQMPNIMCWDRDALRGTATAARDGVG